MFSRSQVQSPVVLERKLLSSDLGNGAAMVNYKVTGASFAVRSVLDKITEIKSLEDYGAVGDGVTDDSVAIQAAFDSLTNGGLVTANSDTYLIEDTVTMTENTTLYLNGATFRFEITGKKRCLVTANGCTVQNGVLDNATTDLTVYGAEWQQPICIGFSDSIVDEIKNVTAHNLIVKNASPEGNAVFVFGASDNITISNIDIPASTTIGEPIGAHWSVEPGGDETQGIGHPNNITFKNIKIGAMSYGGAAACFLSAVRSVTLENITCEDFEGDAIVQVFAGDHGFTYAIDSMASDMGTVINAKNINGKGRKGLVIDMRDTLDANIVWPSSITLENSRLASRDSTVTTSRGLEVGGVDGVTLRNCKLDGFYNGVFVNSRVTGLTLTDNTKVINSYKNGLDADNSVDCSNINLKQCVFKDNNSAGGTGYDMVFGSYMDGILLENNLFDSPNATYNANFLSAQPPRNVRVLNNHVEASAGANFVFGSSSSFGICELFSGNTQGESVNASIRAGQQYVPYQKSCYVNSKLAINYYTGVGTPSYGIYNKGDIVYESDPVSAGKIGSVCVSGGTQSSYTEGLTATANGTATITLSGESNILRKGMYLTINGANIRIESISGTTLIGSGSVTAGSSLAISYDASSWELFGAIN